MFKTKTEHLKESLDNFVPLEQNYENYVSNFNSENCCSFIYDRNNISTRKLYNQIRNCGFDIIHKKHMNNKQTMIIVIEKP
jgi:hypothetical protein